MKKLLAAIVAVAMVLSLAAVPATAATRDPVALSLSEVTGEPGDTVGIAFTIDGDYEAHGMNFAIDYDTDVLEYVNFTRGDIAYQIIDAGGTTIIDGTTIPGSVRVGVVMPIDPMTGSGLAWTFNFRIKDDAPAGTSPVELVMDRFFYMPETTQTPIDYVATDGSVTVEGEVVTPEPVTEEPVTEEPITEEPVTEEPVTEEPVTEEPVTEEPVTEEPVTEEPVTEEPVTEEPVEPTEEPVEPTEEPVPTPPETGAIALIGAGVAAIAAGAGVVLFRKKED